MIYTISFPVEFRLHSIDPMFLFTPEFSNQENNNNQGTRHIWLIHKMHNKLGL